MYGGRDVPERRDGIPQQLFMSRPVILRINWATDALSEVLQAAERERLTLN